MLYDKTDPRSIEKYAKGLVGKTFFDVLEEGSDPDTLPDLIQRYGNVARKGGLGNLLEEVYFGYRANSESAADFADAGVELKATPLERNKKGEMRAGERLVLSMIDYNGPVTPNLYESHFWNKCRLLLLIYYHRVKEQRNIDYLIEFVSLFTPTPTDRAIIENDYAIITQKIISGKAETMSESDTYYLGACTKGATAATSIVPQFYPPHTPAKKRAYCYKQSYMTFILNTYIAAGKDTYESLLTGPQDLEHLTFEQYVCQKINVYRGLTDKQLCAKFDREYNKNKAQWSDLAYRMLGIKSNKAAEFRKANITVKIVRIEPNGKPKENTSFPSFKYMDLINEDWESSHLHNYFDETKLLFVVFRKTGDCYTLQGCKMWNMPYTDLNDTVRAGWQSVVDTIRDGVKLTVKQIRGGVIVCNNFPGKDENEIVHVRPHSRKRYYEFPDGTIIGDGNRSHSNQLPDGTWMPHFCFWLNDDYVVQQLDDLLNT